MRNFFRRVPLVDSRSYWTNRYASGGDSGAGSGGYLQERKSQYINRIVADLNLASMLELGCGDGRQLATLKVPRYFGVDVSQDLVTSLQKTYELDSSKEFYLLQDLMGKPLPDRFAEATLSSDVIYHLVEDAVFEAHMTELFRLSSRVVIVYSSNFSTTGSAHVRHRKFTDWIEKNSPDFELVKTSIGDPSFPKVSKRVSSANFYVFERISANI